MSLGPIGPQRAANQAATRNWVADVYGKPAGGSASATSFSLGASAASPSQPAARPDQTIRKELVAAVVPGSITGQSALAGKSAAKVDVIEVEGLRGPGAAGATGVGGGTGGVYSMYRQPADRMAAAVGVEAGKWHRIAEQQVGRRLDVQG